jgi:hypothetical protein
LTCGSRRKVESIKNLRRKINNESCGKELQIKESADNEDEVQRMRCARNYGRIKY